jgi:hypothetical protein
LLRRGIEPAVIMRAAFNTTFKVFFPSEIEGPSPYDVIVNAAQ